MAIFALTVILFFQSHTVFRAYSKHDPFLITYNDWWIKGRTIEEVEQRYGKLLIWEDRTPTTYHYNVLTTRDLLGLSSYMKWYCMEVDESGVVIDTFVYDRPVQ